MVRFKCGCIGFPINSEQFACISPCEEPDVPPYMTIRQVTKGAQDVYEPLEAAERQEWLAKLNHSVRDGERFRAFQRTIKDLLT